MVVRIHFPKNTGGGWTIVGAAVGTGVGGGVAGVGAGVVHPQASTARIAHKPIRTDIFFIMGIIF